MAVYGGVVLESTFDVTSAGPIDKKMLVDTKDDLYLEATWKSKSGKMFIYNGMTVSTADTGDIYVLTDFSNYTDPSSWKKQGSDMTEIDGGEFD